MQLKGKRNPNSCGQMSGQRLDAIGMLDANTQQLNFFRLTESDQTGSDKV
jgi:hypothetical protein